MAKHSHALQAFHAHYRARYGATPTWDPRTVSRLKQLVAAHGSEEVVRRIKIMFTDAPAWINEPYTVPLLASLFDVLSVPASAIGRAKGGLSGDGLRELADRMDDDETE
jgi:hypothetical protein